MDYNDVLNAAWIFDCEVYPNYFLAAFKRIATGERRDFEYREDGPADDLQKFLYEEAGIIVGFNNHAYDDPVVVQRINNHKLYSAFAFGSNLIEDRIETPWQPLGKRVISIDLRKILKKGGLKELGIKRDYPTLRDLPIKPGTTLTQEQCDTIAAYNEHDLNITLDLWHFLRPEIELRAALSERYGTDVLTLGEEALGMFILKHEMGYGTASNSSLRPKKDYWAFTGKDVIDPRVTFEDPGLRAFLADLRDRPFTYSAAPNRKKLVMNEPELSEVRVGGVSFSPGMGGLHSVDEPGVFETTEHETIVDIDVASYYPALMTGLPAVPEHLVNTSYLSTLKGMIQRRIVAKRSGDKVTAQAFKIALNSIFGKLKERFSWNLDPKENVRVTIGGQLILLMAIEKFAAIEGVRIVSANTDGITLGVQGDQAKIDPVIDWISGLFNVEFERAIYAKLIRRDISNYVAITADGEVKRKGDFANLLHPEITSVKEMDKKHSQAVMWNAVVQHLLYGTDVATYIRGHRHLPDFLEHFQAGKEWRVVDREGNEYQRSNRWYQAVEGADGAGLLFKVKEEDGVEKRIKLELMTDNSKVVNDLPDDFPADLDYDWYIAEAERQIKKTLSPPRKKAKTKRRGQLTQDERDRLDASKASLDIDREKLAQIDIPRLLQWYEQGGNTHDTMRNILLSQWMKLEGQLTRGELLHLAGVIDEGREYFREARKRRELERLVDWVVDTVPFAAAPLPTEVTGLRVNQLSAECGSGKSRFLLKKIVQAGPGVWWWACDHIDPVIEERREELLQMAESLGFDTELIDCEGVHSRDGKRNRVSAKLALRLAHIQGHPRRDETIFVTLITHASLIDVDMRAFTGKLIVDEPVKVWEQVSLTFTDSRMLPAEMFKPEVVSDYDCLLSPEINADTQAARLMLSPFGLRELEQGDPDDSIKKEIRRLLEHCRRTSSRVYVEEKAWNDMVKDGGDVDFLVLFHPNHIAAFEEVWMAAAEFEELWVRTVWEELYGVQFVPHQILGGWTRKVPIRDRVRISYFLEHRQMSMKHMDEKAGYTRAMVDTLNAMWPEGDFLWSSNTAYKKSFLGLPETVVGRDGHEHPAYLSPLSNGVNVYANLTRCAWLGAIKLPNDLMKMIGLIYGERVREMAMRNHEFYSCLQFVSRINLRDFNSDQVCEIVVADRWQAEYLAEKFDVPWSEVQKIRPVADVGDRPPGRGGRRAAALTPEEKRERERIRKARWRSKNADPNN